MEKGKSILIFTNGDVDIVLCEGGVIRKFPYGDRGYRDKTGKTFRYVCKCYGLNTKRDDTVSKYADKFSKCSTLSEFEQYANEEIQKEAKNRELREKVDNREIEERNYLNKNFGSENIICGIARNDIDFYDFGFSLTLLLKTGKTKEQKRAFVHENKGKIIDYIEFFLNQRKDAKGKVRQCYGLFPFTYPTEMVIRRNEVRLTFELKDGIQKVLTSETGV